MNPVCSIRSCHGGTYHFSCSDERTTDTEEAAMAAEPIHGCSTMPKGMKTPAEGGQHSHCSPEKRKESTHHEVFLLSVAQPLTWTTCSQASEAGCFRAGQWGCCQGDWVVPCALTFLCPSMSSITYVRGSSGEKGISGTQGTAAEQREPVARRHCGD